ncbi:MAG: cysteine peptidase family C39 domain-containing protein [Muribaculaceae bacterium]|nr:cysteine peptidase family C39 domain-containing protein [Muribaculaceae bacterium]
MAMRGNTILSHWLELLGVPFTSGYTDRRFNSMPFPSLFGLKKLLGEYGVDSEGLRLPDKQKLDALPCPFLAYTKGGFVIVTSVSPATVSYLTRGVGESIPRDEFLRVWNGTAFLAYPSDQSVEPHHGLHARIDFFNSAKKWVLLFSVILLGAYLYITGGLWSSWSMTLVMLLDIGGLWLTWQLVRKSLHIHTKAADAVCGVLEAGGCDSVLELKASKFFGLFGWSEVGFSYFSVSLLCLLMFPQWTRCLALCNLLCLPFTFWSIWYQRFKAHKWCTLCVCVQATLWLLFFCYLGGGWLGHILPLPIEFFVLALTYVAVLLGINAIMPLIDKSDPNTTPDEET